MNNNQDPKKVIFDSINQVSIQPREAFTAFYLVLTGKSAGPKAGDLINQLGVENVIEAGKAFQRGGGDKR